MPALERWHQYIGRQKKYRRRYRGKKWGQLIF